MNLYFQATILAMFISSALTGAMPPQNPVQCTQTGCTLSNSYGVWGDRKPCHVTAAVFPTTEAELIAAVADASRRKLKVKSVSKFSHTIPKLACGGAILISTERYSSGIAVDRAKSAVTADAGAGLRAVIDRAAEEGLSLAAAPYWEGVSVGGAISTGAHGSSWRGRGGALHDHVIGIRMVVAAKGSEGFAKVVDLGENDELFNAAKLSLGLLGVISKVTFALEPAFKRSITFNFTSDSAIEDEFMEHATRYEFGDIQWYPSRHTAVYRYDVRVPLSTPGEGFNDFTGFQSNFALIAKTVRAAEKAAEKARDTNGKCILASSFVAYKKLTANGLKNNNLTFSGYPVVGHSRRMQTSGSCLYSSDSDRAVSCAWDPRIAGLSFFESTAVLPAAKFAAFVRDVKHLRDAVGPAAFCGADVYNGFLFRSVRRSGAFLGQPEDSVVVDFNYFRADEAGTPRLHGDVWEEVEQMAFFKYLGRPHWGKNRKVAFLGVGGKFPRFGRFLEVRKKMDPAGIFSSEESDEILFGTDDVKTDGCALEGLCICSEDRHCCPRDGYFCKKGVVYEEARVCRYSPTSIS